LQDAEPVKGKKGGASSGASEGQGASGAGKARKPPAKQYAKTLQEGIEWFVIKALDADGKPIPDLHFKLTTPSGTIVEGETPLDGTITVNGIAKGKCKLQWSREPLP